MIMTYLEHINGFMEYCKFNHIYEDVLQTVCPFLKCEKIKKGDYIFKFGEESKAFYTLLKGKISIRVPRNPNSIRQQPNLTSGSDLVAAIKKDSFNSPKAFRKNVFGNREENNANRELNKIATKHGGNNDNHSIKNLQISATKKLCN